MNINKNNLLKVKWKIIMRYNNSDYYFEYIFFLHIFRCFSSLNFTEFNGLFNMTRSPIFGMKFLDVYALSNILYFCPNFFLHFFFHPAKLPLKIEKKKTQKIETSNKVHLGYYWQSPKIKIIFENIVVFEEFQTEYWW